MGLYSLFIFFLLLISCKTLIFCFRIGAGVKFVPAECLGFGATLKVSQFVIDVVFYLIR